MYKIINPLNIAAISAASLIAAHTANAASIFADNFSGATVRPSPIGGFGTGTVASSGNYVSTQQGTFSIQTDTTTGPAEGSPAVADNALQFAAGGQVRAFLTEFPVLNLTNTTGANTLILSFDFRFTTSNLSPSTAGDVLGLRFGIFNSNGSSTVNNNTTADDNDRGYRGGFATDGPANGNSTSILGLETGAAPQLLSGADYTATSLGTSSIPAFGTTTHNIMLSLERTAAGLTLRSFFDGGLMQTQNVLSTAPGFQTSFNELGIGLGGYNADPTFRVDNIKVDLIPEPSAALLFGATGILGLLRRRRA